MNLVRKSLVVALALGGVSGVACADELIGTVAQGKGGQTTIMFDLATGGETTVFEFVVAVPKGATNVDVSKCLSTLPVGTTGKCQYSEKTGEVIAIAYSPTNSRLPEGVQALGSVSFKSLLKVDPQVSIRGLAVGSYRGAEIPSNIQIEDALSGN
jgi:hypothetical protein